MTSLPIPLSACQTQYLGAWQPDVQYENILIQTQPTPYWTNPIVEYEVTGIFYIMNGTAIPTLGMTPNLDSAWTEMGGGGGNENFQGYWASATNTPTLTNGTGTVGFFYINNSTGTNLVNFGAGNISFAQNDIVQYNNLAQWYNAGQAQGLSNVVSSTPSLISVNQANGTATIAAVNLNQVQATSNVFYYTNTDNYVVGAVTVDNSQMVLNRSYGVTAMGGTATLTAINGAFSSGGTVIITAGNSVLLKSVSASQINVY